MRVSTHIARTLDGMCKNMIMLLLFVLMDSFNFKLDWIQGRWHLDAHKWWSITVPRLWENTIKYIWCHFLGFSFRLLVIVKFWGNWTPKLIINGSQNNLFISLTMFNNVQISVFPSYHKYICGRSTWTLFWNTMIWLVMQGHIDSCRPTYEKCISTG